MSTASKDYSSPPPPQDVASACEPALQSFPHLRWKLVSLAVAAALVVFLLSIGLDWFVIHEHEPRRTAIEVSDSLAGLIAGVLVFRLLQYENERRHQLRQRLNVIAEMNHHVRNALQVISLSTFSNSDQKQLVAVRESVDRIQWALKEILPKL